MIEIIADHPIASSVYYRFCFINAHEDSREMLNSSIRDFKMYLSAEQNNNKNTKVTVTGTVLFLSLAKPPFNECIHTCITSSDRDPGRLCVNVEISDTDIWYKWLVWLECQYRLYSMPSKSDLMQFLQEAPIC